MEIKNRDVNSISIMLTKTINSLNNNFLSFYDYFKSLFNISILKSNDIVSSIKSKLHKVTFKYKDGTSKTYVFADIDALPIGSWDKTIEEIISSTLNDSNGIVVNEK